MVAAAELNNSESQLKDLAKLGKNELDPGSAIGAWIWNPNPAQEVDDESWEVKAFAEDTGSITGATWPPRSYTCTFCKREFRSAQALGGHMNVHRRDRAKLHQSQPHPFNPNSSFAASSSSSASALLIPHQELAYTNGGLCVVYQLAPPNGIFTPVKMNATCLESNPAVLSISPYLPTPSINFQMQPQGNHNSPHRNLLTEADNSPVIMSNSDSDNNKCKNVEDEELDLELRLGHKSMSS